MKRNDILVTDLCDEIDDLKDRISYWKDKYENEVRERNDELNERMEQAKKNVGQSLLFALCVKDDENGNLTINKEDRKLLAESFK